MIPKQQWIGLLQGPSKNLIDGQEPVRKDDAHDKAHPASTNLVEKPLLHDLQSVQKGEYAMLLQVGALYTQKENSSRFPIC